MKLISKIASLSVGLALAVGVGVAVGSKKAEVVKASDTITLSSSDFSSSWTGTTGAQTGTVSGFTLSSTSGMYASGHLRHYSGADLTLSSSVGKMSSVVFTCTANGTSNYGPGKMSGTGYVASTGKTGTWTGDADSFTLTGGQSRIVSIEITYTAGSITKYDVIDRVDNGTLNVSQVSEGSTLNCVINGDAGYVYPESVTVMMAGSPAAFTYTNGVVTVENVTGNITIEGECVKVASPILALYSKANNAASGEFYGYYVGFATGSGPILMDGVYGIMLYNSSQDVSAWTEGETIIHVTAGTISIYNGLYEVKNYTCEVVSSADISAPVVHTTTGSETALEANRASNATGYVSGDPTKGNFTAAAGTSDIQFPYTVGSHTFSVFYKKAAQTDAVIAKLADSLANETEIVLAGFTSWYEPNFQLTMIGLIEASEDYTAEEFAQDLLTQTDAVCTGWEEGVDNHDAIEAIWSDLASATKYPVLPSDQKTILAEAARDESGTVIERAMARYDFLTGKYNLGNFINGRTPIVPAGMMRYGELADTNNTMIIVVVIAAVSALAFTTLLVFKKKKHN